jgi:hypothetical protein
MEREPAPTRLRPCPSLGKVQPALFFIFLVGIDSTASWSSLFELRTPDFWLLAPLESNF